MRQPINESEAIRLLCEGQEKGFRWLYDRHAPALLRSLVKVSADEAMAEDLLQEAFLRLWENRARLAGQQSAFNYLFTIARNLFLNRLRRLASERAYAKQQDGQPSGAFTEEQIEFLEASRLAEEGIRLLPPRSRQIFMMSRFEGMSNQEIALALNLSVRTVEDHISVSLKKLRHFFNDQSGMLLSASFWFFLFGG